MIGVVSVLIANQIPGSIPVPINFPDTTAIVLPTVYITIYNIMLIFVLFPIVYYKT